jgi:hypothetical protein
LVSSDLSEDESLSILSLDSAEVSTPEWISFPSPVDKGLEEVSSEEDGDESDPLSLLVPGESSRSGSNSSPSGVKGGIEVLRYGPFAFIMDSRKSASAPPCRADLDEYDRLDVAEDADPRLSTLCISAMKSLSEI